MSNLYKTVPGISGKSVGFSPHMCSLSLQVPSSNQDLTWQLENTPSETETTALVLLASLLKH